jgi:hypothetical protein
MGTTQHNQIRAARASVLQNDLGSISVPDINPNFDACSLSEGAELEQIGDSLSGFRFKALA